MSFIYTSLTACRYCVIL